MSACLAVCDAHSLYSAQGMPILQEVTGRDCDATNKKEQSTNGAQTLCWHSHSAKQSYTEKEYGKKETPPGPEYPGHPSPLPFLNPSCRAHFSLSLEWDEFTWYYSGIKAKTIDTNVRTSYKAKQYVRDTECQPSSSSLSFIVMP